MMPAAVQRTTPPGRYILIYDGLCRFCEEGSRKLARWVRGEVERVDFQQPGALDRFPGITPEGCRKEMYLITPDGRVFAGFEAAVRAVATFPVLGWLAWLYYVPGLRQLFDGLYRRVATHRYRIMGRAIARGKCEGGTCALHLKQYSERGREQPGQDAGDSRPPLAFKQGARAPIRS